MEHTSENNMQRIPSAETLIKVSSDGAPVVSPAQASEDITDIVTLDPVPVTTGSKEPSTSFERPPHILYYRLYILKKFPYPHLKMIKQKLWPMGKHEYVSTHMLELNTKDTKCILHHVRSYLMSLLHDYDPTITRNKGLHMYLFSDDDELHPLTPVNDILLGRLGKMNKEYPLRCVYVPNTHHIFPSPFPYFKDVTKKTITGLFQPSKRLQLRTSDSFETDTCHDSSTAESEVKETHTIEEEQSSRSSETLSDGQDISSDEIQMNEYQHLQTRTIHIKLFDYKKNSDIVELHIQVSDGPLTAEDVYRSYSNQCESLLLSSQRMERERLILADVYGQILKSGDQLACNADTVLMYYRAGKVREKMWRVKRGWKKDDKLRAGLLWYTNPKCDRRMTSLLNLSRGETS